MGSGGRKSSVGTPKTRTKSKSPAPSSSKTHSNGQSSQIKKRPSSSASRSKSPGLRAYRAGSIEEINRALITQKRADAGEANGFGFSYLLLGAIWITLLFLGINSKSNHEDRSKSFSSSSSPDEGKPASSSPSTEPNYFSLESGARILDVQALPESTDRRTRTLCQSTAKYALSSGPISKGNCWWLPGPSGSGFISIALSQCVVPTEIALENSGDARLWPTKISLWSEGKHLATIRSSTSSSSAKAKIGPLPRCIHQVSLYVTGSGNSSEGSCVHRLSLKSARGLSVMPLTQSECSTCM